jgi:hypothetical protein
VTPDLVTGKHWKAKTAEDEILLGITQGQVHLVE